MAKDKDYETLEGGDSASDVGQEYDEKVEDTSIDKGSEEKDVGGAPETEEHRLEDGDEEWDKDQEGADLEGSGEEDESTHEEGDEVEIELDRTPEVGEELEIDGKKYTVSEVMDEGKDERSEQEIEDEAVAEDIIKYLSKEEGGTKYVVKGKEYDLRDLSPQEIRDRFSKAGRFYEKMEEMSAREKQINERERLAEEGARRSQDIMRRYGGDESGKGDESLPEILKPSEDDTDLERSLKELNANLYKKVDKLERGYEQQDYSAKEQQLYRQLDSLQAEFPMMSKSEVVAVKSMPEYADADIRVVAENSHNERIGDKYLEAVFKARPDKLREIEEKAVEKYLMKNPKVRKVSRKKSSTVTSGKVSSGKKRTPRTFDEIEAHEDEFRRGYEASLEEVD